LDQRKLKLEKAGRNCTVRSFIIRQILLVYQTKNDEMGGKCSTHERYEKCINDSVGKPEGNI
jgi:hypothetical protein